MNDQPRDNTIVIQGGVGCRHCHQAIAIETLFDSVGYSAKSYTAKCKALDSFGLACV